MQQAKLQSELGIVAEQLLQGGLSSEGKGADLPEELASVGHCSIELDGTPLRKKEYQEQLEELKGLRVAGELSEPDYRARKLQLKQRRLARQEAKKQESVVAPHEAVESDTQGTIEQNPLPLVVADDKIVDHVVDDKSDSTSFYFEV